MAEEKDTEQTETQALPAPRNSKKMLVIGAVVSLVLGVGAPVGYFIFSSSKPSPQVEDVKVDTKEDPADSKHATLEGHGDSLELEEGEEAIGAIVPFETFLVNLAGGKYIRLQLQVEFESADIPQRFYSRIVPIRDAVIALLTQQSAGDLEDIKGKDKLKKDIKEIINEQLRREDARRVYFTQFVIQ